jgi:hypothetical protein
MTTRYPASYNILKAIERLTLKIKTHSNFNNDIVSASIPEFDIENMKNLPHVNILRGPEEYLTVDDRARTLEQEEKRTDVTLHIYFREKTNPNLAAALLQADFEKQFDKDRNYVLPDENGQGTCSTSNWVSNEVFGTKQSEIFMLEMVLRVWYSTPRGNPYELI